jgi:hypothetical protein
VKRNRFFWLVLFLCTSISWANDNTPAANPKKKLTLLDLLGATTGQSTHSATVAGVRGLEETNAGVDTKARDFAAIDRLDKMTVFPAELQKFIAEGKLK